MKKRPPFRMKPANHAVLTCDGKHVTSARATFVWEQFLMRRISGVPGEYKIRDARKGRPWHRLDWTPEQAEEMLAGEFGGMFKKRRVAQAKAIRARREQRGLPVG